MKTAKKKYIFSAPLEKKDNWGNWYVVYFPHDVEQEFGVKGTIRVKGTYQNLPFDRALIPNGDGTHYLVFSAAMRKAAGLRLGNMVKIELWLNDQPDEIIIPDELQEAFDLEPEVAEKFNQKSNSFKRGVIHWFNTAKHAETKAKRAAEILNRFTSDHPWNTKNKDDH